MHWKKKIANQAYKPLKAPSLTDMWLGLYEVGFQMWFYKWPVDQTTVMNDAEYKRSRMDFAKEFANEQMRLQLGFEYKPETKEWLKVT
jgi:hypothetical protein